jgi:uncharacterized membrane protein HdeD (DUF308 family)
MSADTITGEVKKRAAWTMFMGFLIAVLGLFLIVYPFLAGAITAALLGWILIFVGIAQVIFALHSRSAGRFFLKVLLGVLFGLWGIVLAFFPIAGLAVLTGLLATLLLIHAVLVIAPRMPLAMQILVIPLVSTAIPTSAVENVVRHA